MESTMANDYYKTLGISRSASQEEIAKAYRKLARKYHPDLNPEDQSAKKRFQEIQTAYDTLNDPEKRKMYDQFGDGYEQYRQGNPFGGGGRTGGAGGFDFGDIFGGAGGSGAVDLGDIFRQFGAGAGGSTRSRRTATPRGPDISGEIEVPLRTIIEGGNGSFDSIVTARSNRSRSRFLREWNPGKRSGCAAKVALSPTAKQVTCF